MRVTAAACLVSSGLIACAAVASAEPGGSGDGPGSGSARPNTGESAGRLGHSAQKSPRTVTRPRTASSAPRVPTPPTRPDVGSGEDPSKLLPVGAQAAETPLDGLAGEQPTDSAGPEDPENPKDPEDECGGWWLFAPIEGLPASSTGGGYDGGLPGVARPPVLPAGPDLLPDDLLPESPVLPTVLAAPPVLALPPLPPGLGPDTAAGGDRESGAEGPRESVAPPVRAPERPAPARDGDAAAVPESYRAGYGEYLRTAGMTEVAVVAVPGATAIMLLTGAGGVIGYRQARAGHAIRASAVRRFAS